MDRILPQLADGDPGVYVVDPDGGLRQVHLYQGGDYALTDIIEFFELGSLIEDLAIDIVEFDRKELDDLKAIAEAYRLDYAPEFIAMCLEMQSGAPAVPDDVVRFYGNFDRDDPPVIPV